MKKIPFNRSIGVEKYLSLLTDSNISHMCGDGPFSKKCHTWLENHCEVSTALLTTSCTHALEMAALLCDVGPDDEVIMPSYTFVSTANAFVQRGANVVFVDINPDTMNIDENKIEVAITSKTKVIVPVHYAGVACNMNVIKQVALKHNLFIVEDAAQGMMSSFNKKPLGSLGDIGCISFHETKNYSMGEGGAILVNDVSMSDRAHILREKGTNRSKFMLGEADRYTWVDRGSSYLPSDLLAALLYGQLEVAYQINERRLALWELYYGTLRGLEVDGKLGLPVIPQGCEHNAHMFYIKCKDMVERKALIMFLQEKGVQTAFHYIPLHSSPAGRRFSRFHGDDKFTTKESNRLLRLPMFFDLKEDDVLYVCNEIKNYFYKKNVTVNLSLDRRTHEKDGVFSQA